MPVLVLEGDELTASETLEGKVVISFASYLLFYVGQQKFFHCKKRDLGSVVLIPIRKVENCISHS